MVARFTIVGNKNLFCRITSGCCSNLARNQKVVAILGRVVVESSSSFCKKICTCLRCTFYRSSVNLFCSNWRKSPVWRACDSIKLWVIIHATYLFKYAFNLKCFFSFNLFHFFRRHDLHYLLFIFCR